MKYLILMTMISCTHMGAHYHNVRRDIMKSAIKYCGKNNIKYAGYNAKTGMLDVTCKNKRSR